MRQKWIYFPMRYLTLWIDCNKFTAQIRLCVVLHFASFLSISLAVILKIKYAWDKNDHPRGFYTCFDNVHCPPRFDCWMVFLVGDPRCLVLELGDAYTIIFYLYSYPRNQFGECVVPHMMDETWCSL